MQLCTLWKTVSAVAVLVLLVAAAAFRVAWQYEVRTYTSPHPGTLISDDDDTTGMSAFCNFDRQVCCRSSQPVQFPSTVEEVQALVQDAAAKQRRVRVAGAGHSMSALVCDRDDDGKMLTLVSLDKLQRVLSVERRTEEEVEGGDPTMATAAVVTVEAGIRLIELNRALRHLGLGLKNMGLIQEQSAAGIIATGVHGTGLSLPSVSNAVVSMDLVTGNGTLVSVSATHNGDLFRHARLHLGLFGVVVRISFAVAAAYDLERVNTVKPISLILDNLVQLNQQFRHYQFWWIPGTDVALENKMDRVEADPSKTELIKKSKLLSLSDRSNIVPCRSSRGGADPTTSALPLCKFSGDTEVQRLDSWLKYSTMLKTDLLFAAAVSLPQWCVPFVLKLMPYLEPELHFIGWAPDVLTFPGINYHSVRYTELEYFVPMSNGKRAVQAIMDFTEAHRDDCPVNSIDSIRTIRGDDIPLSPLRGWEQGGVSMSFVLVQQAEAFERCSRLVEQIFLDFGGRPHWGKRHPLVNSSQKVVELYGKEALESFQAAQRSVDPSGMFHTKELKQLFGL